MKNKLLLLALSIILSLSLISCGSNEKQDALLKYLNEDLKTAEEYEDIVVTTYDSITGDNYTDDYTLYSELKNTILPNSLKLIDSVESIECSFDELRNVHELYLNAINKQHQAFTIILSALENQDYSQVAEANELLSQARKGVRDYMAELKTLCTDNDVSLEEYN